MPASVGVKVVGISSAIIELIDKSQCKCTQNFSGECRKKIGPRYLIRYTVAQNIGNRINNQNDNGCNNKVAEFQALKSSTLKVQALQLIIQLWHRSVVNLLSQVLLAFAWHLCRLHLSDLLFSSQE